MAASIGVHLEFRGGAELLFNGVKEQDVRLPNQSTPWDIRQLLAWIKTNMLKNRPELFIQGDTVRPGILVLINDSDWELMVGIIRFDFALQSTSVRLESGANNFLELEPSQVTWCLVRRVEDSVTYKMLEELSIYGKEGSRYRQGAVCPLCATIITLHKQISRLYMGKLYQQVFS